MKYKSVFKDMLAHTTSGHFKLEVVHRLVAGLGYTTFDLTLDSGGSRMIVGKIIEKAKNKLLNPLKW